MDTEIIVALIGLASFILGYLFNKRKKDAVIEKLKAETEKLRSEIKSSGIEVNFHDLAKADEVILYDGTKGINSYDISSKHFHCPYDVRDGVLLISGEESSRYELRTLYIDGKESEFIPKNELLSGHRKLRASCELKAINSSYDVAIYLWETPEREDGRDPSVDAGSVIVTDNQWRQRDFYFKAPVERNYEVNINAERLSGDGSLQIRNLVVAERVS